MPKISNRQSVLKPQDLYVLLALLSRGGGSTGYTELAEQTGLAVSDSQRGGWLDDHEPERFQRDP